MGTRRIASALARAGLHLGETTVRRMLRPARTKAKHATLPADRHVVSARCPNHVWHVDLTTVPASGGFWASWAPFAVPQRWPLCWWVAVVVDHHSRRVLGTAIFPGEPAALDIVRFLRRVCRRLRSSLRHLVTDHGVQFTADEYRQWCVRHEIRQRFGAIGKYGSIAVVERFIRSMKSECFRLLTLVPLTRAAFARELDQYVAWFNAQRPHERLGSRTPDEVYFGKMPASRKPRFEPRLDWPRPARCARPQALVRGRPGVRVELDVQHQASRRHLPIVIVRRAA